MNLTLAAPGCSYRHFASEGGVKYNGTYNRGIICGCENTLDTEHYLGLGKSNDYGVMLDLENVGTVPKGWWGNAARTALKMAKMYKI